MDPLKHVVKSCIFYLSETKPLAVGVSNELEDFNAHKVHNGKVPIPKVANIRPDLRLGSMHTCTVRRGCPGPQIGTSTSPHKHLRWGPHQILVNLGFCLGLDQHVTGLAFIEDDGLGRGRENYGNCFGK